MTSRGFRTLQRLAQRDEDEATLRTTDEGLIVANAAPVEGRLFAQCVVDADCHSGVVQEREQAGREIIAVVRTDGVIGIDLEAIKRVAAV